MVNRNQAIKGISQKPFFILHTYTYTGLTFFSRTRNIGQRKGMTFRWRSGTGCSTN